MKRFSGLPASPAILFPLLHPATWPFSLPLPQDGLEHTGRFCLSLISTSEHPGADQQDPAGDGEGARPARLSRPAQDAALPPRRVSRPAGHRGKRSELQRKCRQLSGGKKNI